MADTTDPQLFRWANERARPTGDTIERAIAVLVAYQADYTAQNINALIVAAGSSNYIGDGSATDGRPRITGLQLQNQKAAIDQLVTAFAVTTVPGVGATPRAINLPIQVNGSTR